MATIYMKSTAPATIPFRFEGLTQSEIDSLLDDLGYTSYETITQAAYEALLPSL